MNREEIAEQEIGKTEISPKWAAVLVLFFLLTLLLIPGIQIAAWVRSSNDALTQFPMLRATTLPLKAVQAAEETHASLWKDLKAGNRLMLSEISSIENELDEVSVFGKTVRPFVQEVLLKLGWGTEKVLPGEHDWLFFKPAVDSLTGPPFLDKRVEKQRVLKSASWEQAPTPDPIPAISQFAAALRKADIELILLPIPVKAGVVPERFSRGLRTDHVLHNSSWPEFLSRLEAHRVRIESIDETLKKNTQPFLKTDTHWTWEAMDEVAQGLAEKLQAKAVLTQATFEEKTEKIVHRGDLFHMLPMLSTSRFPKEEIEIHSVRRPNPDHGNASILLLGDSFSNIFSEASLGWGAHAGLAERLEFHLQAPVKAIIQNNDGAFATRMELIRQISQDPSYLDGVHFLIWEFTERELSFGDWRSLDLTPSLLKKDNFISLKQGESTRIQGVIKEMGEIPDPNQAAYPNYLLALHLVDIPSPDNSGTREALVFVWAMRDYKLLPGAHHHPGEKITLRLQPWSDVSAKLGSITRGEIFDERLLRQTPTWGEEVPQ